MKGRSLLSNITLWSVVLVFIFVHCVYAQITPKKLGDACNPGTLQQVPSADAFPDNCFNNTLGCNFETKTCQPRTCNYITAGPDNGMGSPNNTGDPSLSNCSGGQYCSFSETQCYPAIPVGQPCDSNYIGLGLGVGNCQPNLLCISPGSFVYDAGTCVNPNGVLGDACEFYDIYNINSTCSAGLSCVSTSTGKTCQNTLIQTPGQNCNPYFNGSMSTGDCVDSLRCVQNSINGTLSSKIFNNTFEYVCNTPAGIGASCSLTVGAVIDTEYFGTCESGLLCVSDGSNLSNGSVCAQPAQLYQPCVLMGQFDQIPTFPFANCLPDSYCASVNCNNTAAGHSYCMSSSTPSEGVCLPFKQNGVSCNNDWECSSGICSDGYCWSSGYVRPGLPKGEIAGIAVGTCVGAAIIFGVIARIIYLRNKSKLNDTTATAISLANVVRRKSTDTMKSIDTLPVYKEREDNFVSIALTE